MNMKVTKSKIFLFIVVAYLSVMLYHTRGPTIRIETPEPTQDYIVRCTWTSAAFSLHGGAKQIAESFAVIKSGENFFCGISFWAAFMNGNSGVFILHPIYTRMQGVDENGVTVIHPTSKLTILDEKKSEFEEGKWDKYKWPGDKISYSVSGTCFSGFDTYLKYYSKIGNFNPSEFRKNYFKPMLVCLRRERTLLSDSRIRDGIREKYTDPEKGLNNWWKKMESAANESK